MNFNHQLIQLLRQILKQSSKLQISGILSDRGIMFETCMEAFRRK